MRDFATLYRALDETTKTNRKIAAMREFFSDCSPEDGAWAVYFLSGRRFKRLLPAALLRQWAAEAAGVSDWMFDECYQRVGDLAETIALLLPEGDSTLESREDTTLTHWVGQRVRPLSGMADGERKLALLNAWDDLTTGERFVFNKLVTGGFRVGVSQKLVIRALAEASGLEPAVISHRLMGHWEPTADFFEGLFAEDLGETDRSRPFPFCLAHPLQADPRTLGDAAEWIAEWKWDGIRGQIIRREGESFLWSRGEELILDRFPELVEPISQLPDGTVLDGEILAWKDDHVLPFSELQRRIGRKKVGKKLLTDVPARFVAFDVLEHEGTDVRSLPLSSRRQTLEQLFIPFPDSSPLMISTSLTADSWDELEQQREVSRDHYVEGVMLKRRDSEYQVGRVTGAWWKWKVEPYTCDAVLIYAQRGHGRRAGLYTDYTFAVWDDDQLVPFAKAYSGLTDSEIREVDRFVRKNTLERFGPVRSVQPELVFELAFENIQASKRHKSGIAVRFPRMSRWRHDKRPKDADTLAMVKSLLPHEGET